MSKPSIKLLKSRWLTANCPTAIVINGRRCKVHWWIDMFDGALRHRLVEVARYDNDKVIGRSASISMSLRRRIAKFIATVVSDFDAQFNQVDKLADNP